MRYISLPQIEGFFSDNAHNHTYVGYFSHQMASRDQTFYSKILFLLLFIQTTRNKSEQMPQNKGATIIHNSS